MKKVPFLIILLPGLLLVACVHHSKKVPSPTSHAESQLYSLLALQYQFNYQKINPSLPVLDNNGDTINLKNLIGNTPKIIFRYRASGCGPCNENEILFLKKEKKNILKNIVIITDDKGTKSLKSFMNMSGLHIPILRLSPDYSGLPPDQIGASYYFVLSKDFRVNYMYIPNSTMENFTENYFNTIVQSEQMLHENLRTTKISFEDSVFDFGDVKYKSSIQTNFIFRNTGDQPLIIWKVVSACGCTIPQWSKEPVPPGKSGIIEVRYDSTRNGSFSKEMLVYSNASSGVSKIKIKGRVMK